MSSWMKHKLESRLLGEISVTSVRQMIPGEEELKSLLVKVKEERKKNWLKTQHLKMKIMASGPITSWQVDGGTMETVSGLIFLGSKNHCKL